MDETNNEIRFIISNKEIIVSSNNDVNILLISVNECKENKIINHCIHYEYKNNAWTFIKNESGDIVKYLNLNHEEEHSLIIYSLLKITKKITSLVPVDRLVPKVS